MRVQIFCKMKSRRAARFFQYHITTFGSDDVGRLIGIRVWLGAGISLGLDRVVFPSY